VKVFLKFVFIMAFLVVTLIPTWLFLLIRYFTDPNGFWQNLVLVGLGMWFLGGIQIILMFFWVGVVIFLIMER